MLAKLFSLLFILMPVCLVQAQESAEYVNAFGGVDNYQDSSKIAKTDAQDAMNVLTDTGKLMKRPGSVAIATILNGFPIYTIGEYISPSNVRYLIAQASTTVYASDLGATGFVAIATVTANYALDFAPAFGKVYFTNGIDTPFSWDGTTTVLISSIPKCAQIEFADERLYCSNAPNFRSTMYASRFGDATDWTIPAISPLPADAPNSFTFNRNDGDQILCSKVTPWGKFVGKKNSSYVLKGQDNDRYYKGLISPTVGCLDDRSVQMVDGELIWLAQDSTVYSWNGNEAPKPVSRDIDTYVKSIRQASSQRNNYNTSTLAEWRTGTSIGLDVETWPSTVRPSTWTHTDTTGADFNAGTMVGVSTSIVDSVSFSTWTILSGNWHITNGYLYNDTIDGGIAGPSTTTVGTWRFTLYRGNSGSIAYDFMVPGKSRGNGYGVILNGSLNKTYLYKEAPGAFAICTISAIQSNNTYGDYSVSRDSSGNFTLTTPVGTCSGTDTTYSSGGYVFFSPYAAVGSAISNIFPGTLNSTGTFTSPIFDTALYAPVGGPFSFSDTVPVGSTMAYSVRGSTASNNTAWNAWTLVSTTTSGAYRMSSVDGKRYWQYKADFSTSYSTQTPTLNEVTLDAVSTGTYYSAPQYIGTGITSWDVFSADQQASNLALRTFSIRSAVTPFNALDPSPAWTTQINGTVPTISTSSYVQFKFDLMPTSSTDTIYVEGVNIAWHEGESRPVASLYDDHRYLLCANTTVGTTINDVCLVWQKNKKWVPFSGQSWGALARFNNYPIAGDGSTGSKIWKVLDPTYLNDDGVAINAYWVSKDFDYDKPNQVKVPMKIWFEADALPTSFLTVGFAADKGVTYSSTTVDLAQSAYLNTNVSDIFDGFALGKYFKFKFSDSTLNSTFKLNAYSVYYDSKPLGQE